MENQQFTKVDRNRKKKEQWKDKITKRQKIKWQ